MRDHCRRRGGRRRCRRRRRRRRATGRPSTTTSTPSGSGQTCEADASCSRTSWGVPYGDRQTLDDRESRRERLGALPARRVETTQAETCTQRHERRWHRPRIEKLRSQRGRVHENRREHRAADHRRHRAASNTPTIRPSVSLGRHPRQHRLGDHLRSDEAGAAGHGDDQRDGQHVAARVDELGRARDAPPRPRRRASVAGRSPADR